MTPQKRAVRKCLKSRNTQAIGLCGVVQRYTTFSDKTRTEDGQKNAGQVARELLSGRYRALSSNWIRVGASAVDRSAACSPGRLSALGGFIGIVAPLREAFAASMPRR